MSFFRALLASFSYFSIFPSKTFGERADGDAIALLPIVGLLVGGLSGWGAYGVYLLTHSTLACAIVAWILSIALSGAIHVDGFLDCCDGLFAMATPERRLEIMRDPHHGTYAIVGMAMLSVSWLYALTQISPAVLPWTLAIAAAISRFCASVAASVRWNRFMPVGFLAALVPFFAFLRGAGIWAVGMALVPPLLAAAAVRMFAGGRLGGRLNGDCYGAIIVVTEITMLLAFPFALAS